MRTANSRRALEARGWVNDLSALTLAEMPGGNPPSFVCAGWTAFLNNRSLWLWVSAFAGTRGLCCDRCCTFGTTGKAEFRLHEVVMRKSEIGPCLVGQISGISPPSPRPHEGTLARSSRNVGAGCDGRCGVRWRRDPGKVETGFPTRITPKAKPPDETSAAYGEVVWSWRRDPGVKLAGSVPLTTVAKQAAHRGEHV
jgi:hypothetical protein